MITAMMRIAPLATGEPIDGEAVQRLLRAGMTAADPVEHLRVRAAQAHADVLAFLDLMDAEAADDALRRFVRRVIAITPQLRLWRVL